MTHKVIARDENGDLKEWIANAWLGTGTGTLIHVFEHHYGLSLLNTRERTNGLSNFYVIFPSEEEATMFILRWS